MMKKLLNKIKALFSRKKEIEQEVEQEKIAFCSEEFPTSNTSRKILNSKLFFAINTKTFFFATAHTHYKNPLYDEIKRLMKNRATRFAWFDIANVLSLTEYDERSFKLNLMIIKLFLAWNVHVTRVVKELYEEI